MFYKWNNKPKNYGSRIRIRTVILEAMVPELELELY